MKRQVRVAIGRFVALAALAAGAALYAGGPPEGSTQPDRAFAPVAPIETLMYWQDRALGQVNLGLVKKNTERVTKHAWLLAELANVNSYRKPDVRYRTWALQLRDKASQIARLAEQKKFQQGKQVAREAKAICKKCHDAFREDD